MKNPFVINTYISPEYFCDREKESEEIIRKFKNGNNLVLISPRRMGKTGLIEHCFHHSDINKHYYTFFIDIYATGSLKEFVFKFGKEIFESLKPKGQKFIDKFFTIITSLRPAFKLDSLSGMPVFDIGIGEIREPEFTLEEIFKYLELADKGSIVAIDEFQQIAKYPEKNIEAILRTHIQQCKNTSFIFSGSQQHLMQNIFFSSARPFYQSAGLLTLRAIEEDVYIDFVEKHFEKGGKKISSDLVKKIYQLFEGHTWYMQNIFNELYSLLDQGESCTFEMAAEALQNKINSYESIYKNTLAFLSERQKEALIAIAKEKRATKVTSGLFIKKHGLQSASSVQTSIKQLLEKDLITSENNSYQVYDRFFELWLQKAYGTGYSMI